jgi:hypothetical protein
MDESVEHEEEVIIEDVEDEEEAKPVDEVNATSIQPQSYNDTEETTPSVVPAIQNIDNETVITKLSFNDMDAILDEQDNVKSIQAPKSIERLEEISTERAMQRRFEEDSDDERIQISTQQIDLHDFDELGSIPINHNDSVILDGVEELY